MSKSEYFWLAVLYLSYAQEEEEYNEYVDMVRRTTGEAVMKMFELSERRGGIYDMLKRNNEL